MSILYSKVPPISTIPDTQLIKECIEKNMQTADKIVFAVGYISIDGLDRLNELVNSNNITDVTLIAGMYKNDGIPESLYNKILDVQDQWNTTKIGSIRLVNNMNYHGKLYCFWKDGSIFKTVLGSANLSILAPSGPSARQYELATTIEDQQQNNEIADFIADLQRTSTTSANNLDEFSIIHERIEKLTGLENVTELTDSATASYDDSKISIHFKIPIKAPHAKDRSGSGDYAKSNINVAYSKGRLNSKSNIIDRRNWYETQITVAKRITTQPNYPTDAPFFVVTDDNYIFEAHTAGDYNKQFSAYGSDRILGYWIKGRLVETGLLKAIDNVNDDINYEGVVTAEMLKKAHMEIMVLTKTTRQEIGRVYERKNKRLNKNKWEDKPLDVWTINFKNSDEVVE